MGGIPPPLPCSLERGCDANKKQVIPILFLGYSLYHLLFPKHYFYIFRKLENENHFRNRINFEPHSVLSTYIQQDLLTSFSMMRNEKEVANKKHAKKNEDTTNKKVKSKRDTLQERASKGEKPMHDRKHDENRSKGVKSLVMKMESALKRHARLEKKDRKQKDKELDDNLRRAGLYYE